MRSRRTPSRANRPSVCWPGWWSRSTRRKARTLQSRRPRTAISHHATQDGTSAAQIASDVGNALTAYDITGEQAAAVLTHVAFLSTDPLMKAAVGVEIAQLVTDHHLTVAEAMAGIHDVISTGG